MDETDRLYVEIKRNNLLNILESGTVAEAMDQYALVEGYVLDVVQKLPEDRRKKLERFLRDQHEIKNTIRKKKEQIDSIMLKKPEIIMQQDIQGLIDEQASNSREIYSWIQKEIMRSSKPSEEAEFKPEPAEKKDEHHIYDEIKKLP